MSRGAAQVPPPIDPERPSVLATTDERLPPSKGGKHTDESKAKMRAAWEAPKARTRRVDALRKSWEDPARKQIWRTKTKRLLPTTVTLCSVDPDFDEEG